MNVTREPALTAAEERLGDLTSARATARNLVLALHRLQSPGDPECRTAYESASRTFRLIEAMIGRADASGTA